MNTLKTANRKIDSTTLMVFALMTVIALPVIVILVLAALFFGLPWAWVGGGLIALVGLFIGTIVSAAAAVSRRL